MKNGGITMSRGTSIIEEVAKLPWQVGVVLAILCYPAALIIAGSSSESLVFKSIGSAALTIWPLFSTLFLLAAFSSFVRAWKTRSLFQHNQSLEKIRSLSWQQFESFVGEAFRQKGYSVMETPKGADGGVDLILRKDGEKTFVQCKHWKASSVGIGKIRELLGSMTSGGAHNGIFVTIGTYTEPAKEFGRTHGIRLLDGLALKKMVLGMSNAHLSEQQESRKPGQVLCPKCSAPMVRRVAKHGANAGNGFWGCSTFPKCRGIRNI